MDAPQLRQQDSSQDNISCGKQEAAPILPTEQRAANNYDPTSTSTGEEWRKDIEPWSQSYDIPHSCHHCGQIKVVTDPKRISGTPYAIKDCISEGLPFIRLCIVDKVADLRQALDDKCPLFELWFDEYRDMKDSELLEIFDVDGSEMVQAVLQQTDGTENYRTTEVYGYWDLRLLLQEGQLENGASILRAIIQPDEPRETLTCDPGARDSFEICRGLMSKCLSSHPLCRMPPSSFLPTRLLCVEEHDLRLVETSGLDKSEQCKWCALSYVWGGDVPLKTTKATQFIHKERIPLDTLPQTMKDAVDVCRGIGIRYLWIDALCIIQDDQEDLREELNHMPEVYQYATLTICAASSTSIYDGFLYRRGYWTHGCRPMNLRVAADCSESFILFVYMHLAFGVFELRKDPIFKRAWTYQEYVLSPHILSYRTHHLEWKCRTHTELVGTPEFELPITKTSMTSDKIDGCDKGQQKVLMINRSTYRLSSSTSWNDVIQEYTTRAASLASDKLRALSAVARVYCFETGKKYLAGLWKEDIPIALCWGNGPVGPQLRCEYGPFLTSQRPREYRAPSWSWASIDTPVHYWHEHFGVPLKMRALRVLSADITPTYPDGEFDSIASGSLVIHGLVRAVPLTKSIELQEFRTKDPTDSTASIWIEEVRTNVYPDAFENQPETLDTLYLLLLAEYNHIHHPIRIFRGHYTVYRGLVLRSKSIPGQSNTYSRIGHFITEIYDPNSRVRTHSKVWTPAKFLDPFEDRAITLT